MAGPQTQHLVRRSRCAQLVWINMDQAPARANHGRRGSVSAAPSCLTKEEVHPKTLLRERGFSLGVLIATCTANSNLEWTRLRNAANDTPLAYRSSQVVQNLR